MRWLLSYSSYLTGWLHIIIDDSWPGINVTVVFYFIFLEVICFICHTVSMLTISPGW